MENSISEQKKTGIALLCDMEGRVVASLRDDPALVEHLTLPVAFQCIVEKGSSAKAEGFIRFTSGCVGNRYCEDTRRSSDDHG